MWTCTLRQRSRISPKLVRQVNEPPLEEPYLSKWHFLNLGLESTRPLHSSQHRVTLVQPTPDVTPAQPAYGLKAGTPSPCCRSTSCRSGLGAESRALSPSRLPSVSSAAEEPTVRSGSLVSTSWASGFRKAAGPSMPRSPTKRKQKPVLSALWTGGFGACDLNEHPPNWFTSPALTSTRTSVHRGSHSIICVHFIKLSQLEAIKY